MRGACPPPSGLPRATQRAAAAMHPHPRRSASGRGLGHRHRHRQTEHACARRCTRRTRAQDFESRIERQRRELQKIQARAHAVGWPSAAKLRVAPGCNSTALRWFGKAPVAATRRCQSETRVQRRLSVEIGCPGATNMPHPRLPHVRCAALLAAALFRRRSHSCLASNTGCARSSKRRCGLSAVSRELPNVTSAHVCLVRSGRPRRYRMHHRAAPIVWEADPAAGAIAGYTPYRLPCVHAAALYAVFAACIVSPLARSKPSKCQTKSCASGSRLCRHRPVSQNAALFDARRPQPTQSACRGHHGMLLLLLRTGLCPCTCASIVQDGYMQLRGALREKKAGAAKQGD